MLPAPPPPNQTRVGKQHNMVHFSSRVSKSDLQQHNASKDGSQAKMLSLEQRKAIMDDMVVQRIEQVG